MSGTERALSNIARKQFAGRSLVRYTEAWAALRVAAARSLRACVASCVVVFCVEFGKSGRLAAGLGALAIGWFGVGAAAAAEVPAPAGESSSSAPSFSREIRPIFAKRCVACHGGVRQLGGLSFIYREQALAEGESGLRAITPGSPEESYLLDRVSDPDPDMRMPPSDHGPALAPQEVELLRRWIAAGAPWEEHWAFVAPNQSPPPAVKQAAWPRDPLDRFVLAKLEEAGLAPSPEADRPAWLRRASLDLTGLPPTPEEFQAFAADQRADAYERAVERLLASPALGERWASMWLDLARYADTKGFETDDPRDAWPYRDWVIRALNADMPFDEFTVKQLAGDLLPDATLADRVATAFHRCTQCNCEGGTDDEEFRTAAVLDRVATTWEAWQGFTFRCAQCHDHPYDPIRHSEYYNFVAFFNSSRDEDIDEEWPTAATPVDFQLWEHATKLDRRLSKLRQEIFAAGKALDANTAWRPLRPSEATARGQTRLVVRDAIDGEAARGALTDDAAAAAELHAEGTLAANGEYRLEFPAPAGVERLTALRIDVLPSELPAALKTPEMGFVLTKLEAEVVRQAPAASSIETADAPPAEPESAPAASPASDPPVGVVSPAATPVTFVRVWCDEAEPVLDPQESLRDNNLGWGEYARQSRPRHAVFVVDPLVSLTAGDRLRVALKFHRNATGDVALCIRRGRFALSGDPRWTELATDAEQIQRQSEIEKLTAQRLATPHVWLPNMAEQPAGFARRTHQFERGNWLDKGAAATPGVPEIMPPLSTSQPPDRLAMARWLVAPENPLTARVTVNRFWQELFGVGLVESSDNFGSSGQPPTNQPLLDHLAIRFQRDHCWSVKRLLRDVVLSATYRQSAAASPKQREADPLNRLLSRGPRQRLTGEMVRDQALVLSGKLTATMYGPPVMPPQPEGVWRSVYSGAKWETAVGPDRYRRAVYTYCKRTSGYPSLLTFDMPSRDVCVSRRVVTNTPLQALVTMNDPAMMELAEGLAERMAAAASDPAGRISAAYRWGTGRAIAPAKLARLVALYEAALTEAAKPEGDFASAANDESTAPADDAAALRAKRERAAMAVVASAILNLDDLLTR